MMKLLIALTALMITQNTFAGSELPDEPAMIADIEKSERPIRYEIRKLKEEVKDTRLHLQDSQNALEDMYAILEKTTDPLEKKNLEKLIQVQENHIADLKQVLFILFMEIELLTDQLIFKE